jgi:hypothetical protein
MAVYKSKDLHRALPWCADWYEGPRRRKRFFLTRDEAENCEAAHLASIRNRGLPLTTKALEQLTVGKLLERYRDEITPTKAGAALETYRLNWLLNNEPGKTLAGKSCAFLDRSTAWDYINARKRQRSVRGTPITMRTISRERNLLQNVFEIAREQCGALATSLTPSGGLSCTAQNSNARAASKRENTSS